ncbi:ABC transporter A family member 2-like isoform X1 [Gastrolobium bilobum]|uniref:ABC transporter A family member 2-like isoform X1 n=1 Tax=Gastrolobium bilobum TaxID=150636 RepID=UPI002AB1C52E|nr:ABC transporter A family member 2-like isoform X1 [Gastrolobium bilobum]
MELRTGFPLLFQQYKALLKKNLLLSWRYKRASLLQLLSPLIFIFLIFAIDKAIKTQYSNTSSYKSVTDPNPQPSPPIPPCETKFFVKLPCYDFVWSGDDNPKFHTIVDRIMNNNPGRPISPAKVKSFKDKGEVDAWLFSNPMYCPGALHFMEKNNTVISYGVQTNSTNLQRRGKYEDPTFAFQLPLQLAAEREIARYLIGDPNFSWNVFLKEFAHPAMSPFSAVGSIGPAFFLAIAMFNFVLQMSSLVTEKELKLRQAMSMMGLYDSAYWLSWLTWEAVVTLLSSLLIVLFGMMFQFRFFLKNSFGVLFLVFFLFELNMTGLAFMLSAFIRKSSSATTLGFSIFIIGFLTQLVTQAGFPYTTSISKTFRNIWSLFPPNPFSQALQVLSDAVSTPEDDGLSWSKRGECAPNDDNCVITINDIYIWLLVTFILWFVLAIYFDNIIPNASGVRKSMLYFLNPGYWMGKGGQKVKEGRICSCIGSAPHQEHSTPDDEDVLEEENTVKQKLTEGVVDASVAVQIHGLAKTYPGARNIGCCKCKRTPPYNAVKDLWVNLEKDQLFCLLGPNGAGKTTAINCLTGITPVTDGDALIYGNSVRSSTGMSNIRKLIGVCPQFDILWDALSGEEHLQLFATIKGLSPTSIQSITKTSLEEVRLTESAKVRAGSYSGGMKRRLSVAIALIGDPKLVILDEPTTGMDPITRRHVWDIIENAKRGRAIVLTTHSMEEADILSDRIGIMAKGRLRCIGTSIRLKSRFGTGFIANISFYGNNIHHSPPNGDAISTEQRDAVKQFFKNHLDVVPKEENNNFLTFVIPHDREALLTNFFAELQDREEKFGISDIQLGLTTLEEVFLNIAKQAELESATAEGSLVTLTLTSGESAQIPIGARFVGIPGTESAESPTGSMVEVYWEQDDTGALCISGHSQKVPIPPGVELSSSPAARQRRNWRRSAPVHGVVINPSQVSSVNFQ